MWESRSEICQLHWHPGHAFRGRLGYQIILIMQICGPVPVARGDRGGCICFCPACSLGGRSRPAGWAGPCCPGGRSRRTGSQSREGAGSLLPARAPSGPSRGQPRGAELRGAALFLSLAAEWKRQGGFTVRSRLPLQGTTARKLAFLKAQGPQEAGPRGSGFLISSVLLSRLLPPPAPG